MGRKKTNLRLGKCTLLGHIRKTARSFNRPVRVIRRDLVPRCGPLGGIYTALVTTDVDAVLFLSCDMPFVTEELVERIFTKLNRRKQAIFVRQRDRVGFPFVLRRTALAVVKKQIEGREFSLQSLAKKLDSQTFRPPRNLRTDLFNINTPEDWAVARRLWSTLQH